jgi:hypothetical protein
MEDYLREELAPLLPAAEIDALLSRLRARAHIDRELSAVYLDRSHYHEALDRVHVATAYLEQQVGDHPVFVRHADLAALLDRAVESLADLYMVIGRMPPLVDDP